LGENRARPCGVLTYLLHCAFDGMDAPHLIGIKRAKVDVSPSHFTKRSVRDEHYDGRFGHCKDLISSARGLDPAMRRSAQPDQVQNRSSRAFRLGEFVDGVRQDLLYKAL
jgi:hypothetical protein